MKNHDKLYAKLTQRKRPRQDNRGRSMGWNLLGNYQMSNKRPSLPEIINKGEISVPLNQGRNRVLSANSPLKERFKCRKI